MLLCVAFSYNSVFCMLFGPLKHQWFGLYVWVCVWVHLTSVLWGFEEQGIDESDGIRLDLLIGPAGLMVHTQLEVSCSWIPTLLHSRSCVTVSCLQQTGATQPQETRGPRSTLPLSLKVQNEWCALEVNN